MVSLESYGERVDFLRHCAAVYRQHAKWLDGFANKLESEKKRHDFSPVGDPKVAKLAGDFILKREKTLLPILDQELNALLNIAVP